MIDARSVTVRFGSNTALDREDVTVIPGQITGICGRSGSGKTTLLRVLAGQRKPDSGAVLFDGQPIPRPGSIALLDQHPRLVCNPRWTLSRTISEPAHIAGSAVVAADFAARTGLDIGLLSRFPSQVSEGQLQRAAMARVLVQRPDYLMCDEPTAMLDPIATTAVLLLIKQLAIAGAGVVLVSHDADVVGELCSNVTQLA